MRSVLVVGAGAVGTETARQLSASSAIGRVLLCDRDPDRAASRAAEAGDGIEPVEWRLADPLPPGIDGVAVAAPALVDVVAVTRALEAGVPAASCSDDVEGVRTLFGLRAVAEEVGVAVVAGAGLAPGISELLARYAAASMDGADEVVVARYGAAGAACVKTRRKASWGRAEEVSACRFVWPRAGGGRRIVAFPEPVGLQECRRVRSPVPRLVVDTIPGVASVTVLDARRRFDAVSGRVPPSRGHPQRRDPLGAVVVEVWGTRSGTADIQVLGCVDRAAVAAGGALAVAVESALGVVPGVVVEPGVSSLAGLEPAGGVLNELARRGVRVAQFEGADPG